MVRLIIKELAEEKKISQSRLQREAGVTMNQLRRYWNNESESVVLDALAKIARVLGVQTSALIVDEDKSEKTQ